MRDDAWQLRSVRAKAATKVEFLSLQSAKVRDKKHVRARRAEDEPLWEAIRRLRRQPTESNVAEAKRAFRILAMRYHPDHGGDQHAFIELRREYERALAAVD